MTDKQKRKAAVTGKTRLADGIYSLWIKDAEMAGQAGAGRFVSLYSRDKSRLLPRPISICDIDREGGTMRLVFRVVGEGTEEFSKLEPGDLIEVTGPLGNGFTPEGKRALVVGGGIGIPPLLLLVKELAQRGEGPVTAVLGYRDELFLAEEFKPYAKVLIATEDGSTGVKGTVLDAIRKESPEADMIYACGPQPMLQSIKAYAQERELAAQISMEERMACGIGACLACVCGSVSKDEHTNVNNKRICREGPVFYASEIVL